MRTRKRYPDNPGVMHGEYAWVTEDVLLNPVLTLSKMTILALSSSKAQQMTNEKLPLKLKVSSFG